MRTPERTYVTVAREGFDSNCYNEFEFLRCFQPTKTGITVVPARYVFSHNGDVADFFFISPKYLNVAHTLVSITVLVKVEEVYSCHLSH